MEKVKFSSVVRTLIFVAMFGTLVLAPNGVRAQTQPVVTQLVIGVPAQSNLGELLTVQAVLTDGQGHPIPQEVIYFTTRTTFLGKSGKVLLAQAVTNGSGQAVAQFTNDSSGTFELVAEFQGDGQYAASNATAQVETVGSQQIYTEHIGVDIPGFNVPPVGALSLSSQSPSFISNLWPAMNGWPIAAALFLVWFMYFLASRYILRVAMLGKTPGEPEFPVTPVSRRLP